MFGSVLVVLMLLSATVTESFRLHLFIHLLEHLLDAMEQVVQVPLVLSTYMRLIRISGWQGHVHSARFASMGVGGSELV